MKKVMTVIMLFVMLLNQTTIFAQLNVTLDTPQQELHERMHEQTEGKDFTQMLDGFEQVLSSEEILTLAKGYLENIPQEYSLLHAIYNEFIMLIEDDFSPGTTLNASMLYWTTGTNIQADELEYVKLLVGLVLQQTNNYETQRRQTFIDAGDQSGYRPVLQVLKETNNRAKQLEASDKMLADIIRASLAISGFSLETSMFQSITHGGNSVSFRYVPSRSPNANQSISTIMYQFSTGNVIKAYNTSSSVYPITTDYFAGFYGFSIENDSYLFQDRFRGYEINYFKEGINGILDALDAASTGYTSPNNRNTSSYQNNSYQSTEVVESQEPETEVVSESIEEVVEDLPKSPRNADEIANVSEVREAIEQKVSEDHRMMALSDPKTSVKFKSESIRYSRDEDRGATLMFTFLINGTFPYSYSVDGVFVDQDGRIISTGLTPTLHKWDAKYNLDQVLDLIEREGFEEL